MSKLVTTAAFAAALALLAMMFSPDAALAQDAKASAGDTAWILTATALVLFMTLPGWCCFTAGWCGRNLLSVLMQCFAVACLMSVMWLVIVYSLAFGDGGTSNAWIGRLDKAFLFGIGADRSPEQFPSLCSSCSR